jgi:hypothetical protein
VLRSHTAHLFIGGEAQPHRLLESTLLRGDRLHCAGDKGLGVARTAAIELTIAFGKLKSLTPSLIEGHTIAMAD